MKKIIVSLLCGAVSFGAHAAGNIDAGKALSDKYSCAACHGKDLGSPIDPSYPKLAGQHKDYLEHAYGNLFLLSFFSGSGAGQARHLSERYGEIADVRLPEGA